MRVPVEGHNDLVKDTRTGAVLNKDSTAYSARKRNRRETQTQQQKIQNLESRLDSMQSDVTAINTTLEQILALLGKNN